MSSFKDNTDTAPRRESVFPMIHMQETHKNLIVSHQNEANERQNHIEPPHKRSHLSFENHRSIDCTHDMLLVTVPLSEKNQSFEVGISTITEVVDNEHTEGNVSQIQNLQIEQQYGMALSANEVSVVNQAWFTSKKHKDSLTAQGHTWKQGIWSKEETDILMNNIEFYMRSHGIQDITEILFEMSRGQRKDFYRTVACGLNRPLFAVYRRVLRMYDERNHVGMYTPEEMEKLKQLRIQHGNNWATIGAMLGRSASSVKDRCRLMKQACNMGKWTEEEERRLTDVVHELTSTEPGEQVSQGVPWVAVAQRVGTRSAKQCRAKWLNYLNWKETGGMEWTKADEVTLILRLAALNVAEENDIHWDLLAKGWSSVRSPQWLRHKWWNIKKQILNHKDISFPVLVQHLRNLYEYQIISPMLLEKKTGPGVTGSDSGSTAQLVPITVMSFKDNTDICPALKTVLQIPTQISFVSSTNSPAATSASETQIMQHNRC